MLGIWIKPRRSEILGRVCAQLANPRAPRRADRNAVTGLTGFPEAIEATWPRPPSDLCGPLIRAAMRFVSPTRHAKPLRGSQDHL